MTFDLKEIIERYSVQKKELEKVLFPNNKCPYSAVDRVLKGRMNLDTAQLDRLAAYLCVPTASLVSPKGWTSGVENDVLTLSKGPWVVKMNCKGAFLTIVRDGEVVDQLVTDAYKMKIGDFVHYLDNYINNLILAENGMY